MTRAGSSNGREHKQPPRAADGEGTGAADWQPQELPWQDGKDDEDADAR